MIGAALTLGLLAFQGGGTRLLVVTGLSGEPEYAVAFTKFGRTVVDAAKTRWGLADSSIVYLAENQAADPSHITGRSTRDAVLTTLARFARETGVNDQVIIVLAGHGSEQETDPRLNLPGPDLGAADLARALAAFSQQTVIVVNTASASGGFIKPLSGPRRVLITATKSGFERNATMFGDFFAKALSTDDADVDKDGRVSVAEAYQYAHREVVRAYQSGNRLLTEHSQLDDNGDGVGSAELTPNGDGAVARLVTFALTKVESSTDPKIAALLVERRRLETAIAELRGRKASMDSTGYQRDLEQLLIRLAETNQSIRAAGGKP